jgi:hypothetical protein
LFAAAKGKKGMPPEDGAIVASFAPTRILSGAGGVISFALANGTWLAVQLAEADMPDAEHRLVVLFGSLIQKADLSDSTPGHCRRKRALKTDLIAFLVGIVLFAASIVYLWKLGLFSY